MNPTPIGIRQDPELCRASVSKLIQSATKMPSVIKSWYVLTSEPRTCRGPVSLTYIGTMIDNAPTPAPAISRPTAICCQTCVEAICITTPTMKTIDQKVIEGFRPMRSAIGATRRAPARVPMDN